MVAAVTAVAPAVGVVTDFVVTAVVVWVVVDAGVVVAVVGGGAVVVVACVTGSGTLLSAPVLFFNTALAVSGCCTDVATNCPEFVALPAALVVSVDERN